MINGESKICGVIGNPIAHTLSPLIHNNLAREVGVNMGYVPFHVKDGQLENAIKGAYGLNIRGLNVTIPYKNDCMKYLVKVDPLAERIGAVNTLVWDENGYKGYNTDMPGLYRAMCSDGISFENEKILILGAGGVARAVGMMLAEKEVREIVILNRTLEKAMTIAEEVNGYCKKKVARAMKLEDKWSLEGEDYIAIQATNVGMHPKVDEAIIEEDAFYQKIKIGYDLIYNPETTLFMKKLQNQGKPAFNGAKMLLYQGIIAFELFTEKKVSEEIAESTYEKMMRQLREGRE